jgi:hypothetical protein
VTQKEGNYYRPDCEVVVNVTPDDFLFQNQSPGRIHGLKIKL